MIDLIAEMLSFSFMVRAMIVGTLVSLCAALLGVSLVLKRYSMIGDGLSHVGFGTLAIAASMNAAPLAVSIPVVVLAAFLLLRLSENSKLKGDAAIAMISTGSLAVGVTVISLTRTSVDICNYLFGSIITTSRGDVPLSVALSTAVLGLFVLFYNKIFAVTFDENFARGTGIRAGLYNMLIAFLTAVTIVLGMRLMGALLISSLIIFPALTSMRLCKRFLTVTLCSAAVSLVCFLTGITVSYVYETPTGASVVLVNILAFLLFWAASAVRKWGKNGKAAPVAAAALALVFVLGACKSGDKVIEIGDKMFVTQVNDIYYNAEEYLGKTITYEGYWMVMEYNSNVFCYVLRNGPGCCAADETVGFQVNWDGALPEDNAWVKVTGVLDSFEMDGSYYLIVRLSELEELPERGEEWVYQ